MQAILILIPHRYQAMPKPGLSKLLALKLPSREAMETTSQDATAAGAKELLLMPPLFILLDTNHGLSGLLSFSLMENMPLNLILANTWLGVKAVFVMQRFLISPLSMSPTHLSHMLNGMLSTPICQNWAFVPFKPTMVNS